MRRLLSSRRGETLVEVLCAAVLLVIALGTLLGAVRFSSSAQRRQENMGRGLEELRDSLMAAEAKSTGETAVYRFAKTAEGEAAFTVTAALGAKEGAYTGESDTQELASFYVFLPSKGGGA